MNITVKTQGEGFYSLDQEIQTFLKLHSFQNGILFLFCLHTSCALTISESFELSAQKDCENFLKHLAPRNLPFITHTSEGPDDSPSHMKSMLLHPFLALPIENGQSALGDWGGVFLAEFRDHSRKRTLKVKFNAD